MYPFCGFVYGYIATRLPSCVPMPKRTFNWISIASTSSHSFLFSIMTAYKSVPIWERGSHVINSNNAGRASSLSRMY